MNALSPISALQAAPPEARLARRLITEVFCDAMVLWDADGCILTVDGTFALMDTGDGSHWMLFSIRSQRAAIPPHVEYVPIAEFMLARAVGHLIAALAEVRYQRACRAVADGVEDLPV